MSNDFTWLAALLTLAMLVIYEISVAMRQRHRPAQLARTAHAALREEWFQAVSAEPGSEVLAVQTLRNSLMSSTMLASTSVLGLMGTITLAAPSLHASLNSDAGLSTLTPRLLMELALLVLLFSSLLSSVTSVRYYNHAGFICAMPVGSAARQRWAQAGAAYVRRAGVLYGWGMRHLIMVGPLVTFILQPAGGPIAALAVVAVMLSIDKVAASPVSVSDQGR